MKLNYSLALRVTATTLIFLFSLASVHAQERQRVVASEYGFSAEDSTEALQKAIDSGAKVVVVDKQNAPWIVNRTLTLRNNLELVFEEGVELQAKKGCFLSKGDVLLRAVDVKDLTIRGEGKGATLRMRKRDYWSAPYEKSEWRHGISLSSAENVLIENLQISETGGDGIYVGTSGATKRPCRGITIRNVDCVENNRQGISVINVDGLIIEDCVLRDTNGTPPAAGIDFEPNGADEQITNVVMRRVVAINNAGDGFTFYLPQLRSRGHELSFVIEDCDSVRNAGMGLGLTVANGEDKRQTGSMIIRDTRIVGNQIGIAVRSKWSEGAPLLFKDVVLTTPSADKYQGYSSYKGVSSNPKLPEKIDEWTKTTSSSGICLIATGPDEETNGGVTFENVQIVDATPDSSVPLLALRDASADGVGFDKISGEITSVNLNAPDKSVKTTLNKETIGALFPYLNTRKVVLWNLDRLNDPSVKEVSQELAEAWSSREKEAKPLRLRGDAEYYVYAKSGESVKATFVQRKIGSYEPRPVEITVTEPDGTETQFPASLAVEEPYKVEFQAEKDGWRRISAAFGASSLELVDSTAPVLTSASPKADVFGTNGRFEFYVPEGTKDLAVRVVGSPTERVSVRIFAPDGEEVATLPDVELMAAWTAPMDDSGVVKPLKKGFWTLEFDKPSVGVLEDYIFSIQGAPALVR